MKSVIHILKVQYLCHPCPQTILGVARSVGPQSILEASRMYTHIALSGPWRICIAFFIVRGPR